METVGIRAASWVVEKALSQLTDPLKDSWTKSSSLAFNVDALQTELLAVQAMLHNVQGREIHNPALAELLQKLRGLAYSAGDVLDELDYFRIQDELEGTFETFDRGCFHNLVRDARHTVKNAAKQLECTSCFSSSSTKPKRGGARRRLLRGAWPCCSADEEESCKCVRQITNSGKRLLCSKTPKLDFDRVDISRRMRHIADQLQRLRDRIFPILDQLLGLSRSTDLGTSRNRPISTSRSTEPKFYGRDFEKNTIIEKITKGKYVDEDLNVLSIVGLAGLGKTTLTQEVYNTPDVQNHFQITVWICVSFRFDLHTLTQEIAKSIFKAEGGNEGAVKSYNFDQLQREIEKRIKNKRLLLVLDDIWKYDVGYDWNILLSPLRNGQIKGNTVLFTSRFLEVAKQITTIDNVIQLDRMNPVDFWSFFVACVSWHGESKQLPEGSDLNSIGKQIVEKLKGSPLAAKTVGRLLRKSLTLDLWTRVLESKEWESQTSEHDIMPALKLSYDHLPFYLQQCFSYCALFPEDYKFDCQELIRFWIGLDILRPCQPSNKTIEDIGRDHLDELIDYGFFKKEIDEQKTYYAMHDLLHDLAQKVSSQECLHIDSSSPTPIEIPPTIYHLSINLSPTNSEDRAIKRSFKKELDRIRNRLKYENLHSLIIFGQYDQSFVFTFCDMFKDAKSLRLVHLPTMTYPVESIFYNFSKLLHLRYLKLESDFEELSHLPSSISRFYHLRVLDIQGWHGADNLPKDMSNLSKLRHFIVPNYKSALHSYIPNVGKLSCLQELLMFNVKEQSNGFQLTELGELTQLGGSLCINNLGDVQVNEAREAKLLYKKRLWKLSLNWKDNNKNPHIENQILEILQPHSNLSELQIQNGGSTCPTWLGTSLSLKRLETLCLDGVEWKMLPPLGELWLIDGSGGEYFGCITGQNFQNLKRLELIGLLNFRKWEAKTVCPMLFKVIKVLIVQDCRELTKLPFSYHTSCLLDGDGKSTWFPRLSELRIDNCPKLVPLPPIPFTQTLCYVDINNTGTSLKRLCYRIFYTLRIEGNKDLNVLDDKILGFHNLSQLQELVINNCPLLARSYLHMLTSLKYLELNGSSVVFHLSESSSDDKWQLPVEHLRIDDCHASGKALSQLLSHLPKLSEFSLSSCHKITRMCIAVEQQQTTAIELEDTQAIESIQQQQQVAEDQVEEEEVVPQLAMDQEDEDGMLIFPAHLSNSLQQLYLNRCPELILDVARPALPTSHEEETGGWGLKALRSLQILEISSCPMFLSAYEAPGCPFPSSLQYLSIYGRMKGVQTLDFISNLNFLTKLSIRNFGEDLRCEGVWSLLTQGQLSELLVLETPRFFDGLDPKLGRLQDEQEQQLPPLQCSSKPLELETDDFAGVLVMPICGLLSSSLTELVLQENDEVERFTKEQEDALQLLTSLQDLLFLECNKLQCLPMGLHRLTSLKRLEIRFCPSIRSLPKGSLPSSLQELDVRYCDNKKLKQRCKKLKGIIPKIKL